MRKRALVGLLGVFLSVGFLTTGTVWAQDAADPAPKAKEGGAVKKKTPQAAIDWYQKQIQRMEQQKRGIELRQSVIQQEQAEQPTPLAPPAQ